MSGAPKYVATTWLNYRRLAHAFQSKKTESVCRRIAIDQATAGAISFPRCGKCEHILRSRAKHGPRLLICPEPRRWQYRHELERQYYEALDPTLPDSRTL